jgi:hypothetical protein
MCQAVLLHPTCIVVVVRVFPKWGGPCIRYWVKGYSEFPAQHAVSNFSRGERGGVYGRYGSGKQVTGTDE